MSLSLTERKAAFAKLSDFLIAIASEQPDGLEPDLQSLYQEFNERIINQVFEQNPWFIPQFVRYQLQALGKATTAEKLDRWLAAYPTLNHYGGGKTIAVIMAGNVPFVGFSDFISVLMAGHKFLGKLSSKDKVLPVFVAKVLMQIEPRFAEYIQMEQEPIGSKHFDAVIATGSDNSARYFEYYFRDYPRIIRRNRTSVAVLQGDETREELEALADDVFLYFGLGCRNVSKLYLPQGFDLNRLFEAFYKYRFVIDNPKYANNYEYNRAVFLLNRERFWDNGFVLLKPEDIALVSPTAVVYFQNYRELPLVRGYLDAYRQKIQCVVSREQAWDFPTVGFGRSQEPELWEYPDGVDIMEFLLNL